MKKNIIWLASYPKSGNTWFRIFMSALLKQEAEKLNINQLKTNGVFSLRDTFDDITGIESGHLTDAEEQEWRPKVFETLAQEYHHQKLLIKAHDAYSLTPKGRPLYPVAASKVAIYLIRNPLDVAVSYAHHNGHRDIGRSVTHLCNVKHALNKSNQSKNAQLPQLLLDWKGHVESWTTQSEIPVHVVRYEDMKLNAFTTFSNAVKAIGYQFSDEQIQEAISASDFSKVKAMETKYGFNQGSLATYPFFRKGEIGSWKNQLTSEQVTKIIQTQGIIMKRFGYLDEDNHPVF